MAKGDKMRNVTIAEMKANEGADKAILEIDEAVRESTAALDSGKVRPSVSGLVRHASGLVRDRVDIKGLRKLKRDLVMGEIGIASAYTILCGIIGLVICGPAAVGCSLIGAAVCGIATYLLIDYTIDDAINDIHSLMEDLGCYCASYC
jgi:hypothetical protein